MRIMLLAIMLSCCLSCAYPTSTTADGHHVAQVVPVYENTSGHVDVDVDAFDGSTTISWSEPLVMPRAGTDRYSAASGRITIDLIRSSSGYDYLYMSYLGDDWMFIKETGTLGFRFSNQGIVWLDAITVDRDVWSQGCFESAMFPADSLLITRLVDGDIEMMRLVGDDATYELTVSETIRSCLRKVWEYRVLAPSK